MQSSINRGEQALVFCSTRESTVKTAKALSKELRDAPPALSTIKSANDLPDTSTREELQDLLQAGVAYHNSDLTLDERLLVEEGFRRNDINVITCTSTLAMGVNIPARNAIIYEPYKWSGSARRFIPIAVSEYKNMTGRAGRYSFGDLFGLSYLIAESEAERDKFDMNFIMGALEVFSSKFGERPIDSQVLDIIAGGLAETESDVQSFIFATYNGKHSWTTDKTKSTIKGMISDSISRCLKCEALTLDKSGSINVTDSGRLCAAGGFSLSHLERASDYFNNYEKDVDLSVIYWALDTDVAAGTMAYHIGRLRTPEFTCFKYQNAITVRLITS